VAKKTITPDYSAIIFSYAEAFAEAIETLAPQFKRVAFPVGPGVGNMPDARVHVSKAAPTAPFMTVDSFSLELYLKCLWAMDHSGPPPYGHDIAWFYKKLKRKTKKLLRDNYDAVVAQSGLPDTMDPRNRALMSDFKRYLKFSNRTFLEVRYLYEREWMKKPRIRYWSVMRNTVRKTILDIRPDLASTPYPSRPTSHILKIQKLSGGFP
jgi:hypothetical protein